MISSSMEHFRDNDEKTNDGNIPHQKLYENFIKIVGCEEDIRLKQRIIEIMDIVNGFGDDDSLSAPACSLSEGLDMKGSDEDKILLIIKYVDVILSMTKVASIDGVDQLYMDMDKTRPGCAKLFVLDNHINSTWVNGSLIQINDRKLVSCAKFRGLSVRPGWEQHGPCISDRDIDFAISFRGAN